MKTYFYHHDHLKRYLSSKMAVFFPAMVELAILFGISIVSSSAATVLNSFEMEAEGSYSLRGGDTKTQAQSLAVFAAKRSAVQAAARYFSQKELIELFGKKRPEIINMTADNLTFTTLQESWPMMENQPTCSVRIKLVIKPSDFIEAQIENLQLEKKVSAQSYREEMEAALQKACELGSQSGCSDLKMFPQPEVQP